MTPTPPPTPLVTTADPPAPVDVRVSGHVVWFCADRGFGYLHADVVAEPVFVRWSDIDASGFRTVVDDQAVTFTLDVDADGPIARGVRPVP